MKDWLHKAGTFLRGLTAGCAGCALTLLFLICLMPLFVFASLLVLVVWARLRLGRRRREQGAEIEIVVPGKRRNDEP